METDITSYFQKIEEGFCRHRGAPLLLSPLDYAKALEWFEAGIPEEAVTEGVRRYFERLAKRKVPMRRAICLSFAERQILKVVEERRAASIGRAAGLDDPTDAPERVKRFIESRIAAIDLVLGGRDKLLSRPVLTKSLEEARVKLGAILARSSDPRASIEAALAPLDSEIGRIALLESPPEAIARWRDATLQKLAGVSCAMGQEVLMETVERMSKQAAMKELGLPRISLLYMEE